MSRGRVWAAAGLVGIAVVISVGLAASNIGPFSRTAEGPKPPQRPALSNALLKPGFYHQVFETTTARPIPGDRRHWGISPAGTVERSVAWTELGRNGVVVKRIVITSKGGKVFSRSLQVHGRLDTYVVGSHTVSTEPVSLAASYGGLILAQIVNGQSVLKSKERYRSIHVRFAGIARVDGWRVRAVHLAFPVRGVGIFEFRPSLEKVTLYFLPGTGILRAIDTGQLPAESCRHVGARSMATCKRYASRARPFTRTVWTLSRQVPRSALPKHVFALGAPRHAHWSNPVTSVDQGLF